jgi:hypothetical protein
MILQRIIAVIFALFVVLFIAVVIEESFLGGRRRRKLEREYRQRNDASCASKQEDAR